MSVTFGSARLASRDALTAALPARSESYATGATVSTKPVPGSDAARPIPWVEVQSAGIQRGSTASADQSVRVTVWHTDEGNAEALATLCESLLLAYSGGPVARGYSEGVGALTTYDEEAGLWLAFLTITAHLRPLNL